jgi:endonuclease YncB( thermonuclease family)
LLIVLPACGHTSVAAAEKLPAKWEMLKDCHLLNDKYRDGDSFHVTYDGKEFVFRLYFVDAPETDLKLKDRVRKQQTHFGVTQDELKQAGEAARQFTAAQLNRPFTVTTRWENAGGRGSLPSYFALVAFDGRDLGELLVSKGLARAFGESAILPSGLRAKDHRAKLRGLERQAKANGMGIWKNSTNHRK